MSDNNYDNLKIQELFEKLEEIINKMENDENISLEDSFDYYKEGTKMLEACKLKINEIEQELEEIKVDDDK